MARKAWRRSAERRLMTCVPQDHARSTVCGTGCPRQFHERSTAHPRPQPCLPARSWPVPRPVHTRAPWPWQAPHPRMIRRQATESGAFSLPVPREFHESSTPHSARATAVPRHAYPGAPPEFHANSTPLGARSTADADDIHDNSTPLGARSTTHPRVCSQRRQRVPRQFHATPRRGAGSASGVCLISTPVPRQFHGPSMPVPR